MNSYEERKQAKIEYALKKASELKASSDQWFSKGFCDRTGIPMGQPILVGHHSEKRHRAAIKRYENRTRKEIDNYEKSKYYAERAERLQNDTVISSDDPDAVWKLEKKINALEIKRHEIKAAKKKGKEFPHYTLPYLGQEIRRLKQRQKQLQKTASIDETEEDINGIKLKVDKDLNRVQLHFDGKPNSEIRTKLKRNGFRWSPYNMCWQKQLNEWNLRNAREVAGECG